MKTTDLSNIMRMAWRFYRTTHHAFAECLKLAWRNFNLVRHMHTEVVRFYFRKVDGTLREAWGTLRADLVPPIEGNDTPSWFTGHKESSRLAITGGLLQRIASPLYLYAGAGYGSRIMGWEMPDDQMAECKDYSYEGVEAEVGCILRIKNIALSAGVQTNSFKYWEATAGIGIMF